VRASGESGSVGVGLGLSRRLARQIKSRMETGRGWTYVHARLVTPESPTPASDGGGFVQHDGPRAIGFMERGMNRKAPVKRPVSRGFDLLSLEGNFRAPDNATRSSSRHWMTKTDFISAFR
jgi:hypothetical protein